MYSFGEGCAPGEGSRRPITPAEVIYPPGRGNPACRADLDPHSLIYSSAFPSPDLEISPTCQAAFLVEQENKSDKMSVTSSTIIDPSMSLHQPKKSSEISKTYKEATALYLTRRLPEALATIQPLVSETHSNQDSDNDEASNVEAAPIASASRKIRIKVWCLYLTLLNSIASLGPGEGKETFGAKEWKNLVTKAQEGSIWQDVVRTGYGGIESNVDIEVVTNLSVPKQSFTEQSY